MNKDLDYHLGLDIGTSSIGFSAIDRDYRPIRLKGKTVIGTRLFQEGQTAADRRGFRTTRRRLQRRRWRLRLLEEIFDPAMSELDPTFFARLRESNRSPKDPNKHYSGSLLFPKKTDRAFYDQYPTIYHLRYALLSEHRQFDLREVYLAIHHIVKYRGNFLNPMPESKFNPAAIDLAGAFEEINENLKRINPATWLFFDPQLAGEALQILLDQQQVRGEKQKALVKLLNKVPAKADKEVAKQVKAAAVNFAKAVVGYKFALNAVLGKEVGDEKEWKLQLSASSVEEDLAAMEGQLTEPEAAILDTLVSLYGQLTLNEIVPAGQSLSKVMVQKYNAHQKHLKLLKTVTAEVDRKAAQQLKAAYANYVGRGSEKLTQADFMAAVAKILKKETTPTAQAIKELIDKEQFMPKQRTNQNGVIPYQLHLKELNQIIANQAQYYPWVGELNPNLNRRAVAKYKLSELVAFRIPYYVGPLITKDDQQQSSGASFAWMGRKEKGPITPWNFDEKVSRDASANEFIRRMTTKDTYLLGEDVLPKHSLTYERYEVLDELNKLRVNGHKLEVGVKQAVYRDLFQAGKTVTTKKLSNYLQLHQQLVKRPVISGLADPKRFNSSLVAYNDLKKILGPVVDQPNRQADLERIIEWATVFEDRQILAEKLTEIDWLTTQQRARLAALRYQGWGRFSKKLLCQLRDQHGHSILERLWQGQETFMQLQAEPVFAEQIKEANQAELAGQDLEDVLAAAYTSPQNKKAIRQVIRVVDDVVRAAKKPPRFISIEFARDDRESRRTTSRLNRLQEIYETTAKELVANKNLREELAGVTNLSDRLYLYFTQLGRDAYTGKPISLDRISTDYDIDHILPQAFIKDDSLDNRVLVSRAVNNGKSNQVPLRLFGTQQIKAFWKQLFDVQLISRRKYNNLLTDPDQIDPYKAQGFINRQLVETRQVIKLAANLLASRYPDTKIIEVKAELTHQVRTSFNLYKNRDVNDYHHAVDGYLSAVVGQYLYRCYPSLQPYFVYGEFKHFGKNSQGKFRNFNFLYDLIQGDQQRIVSPTSGEVVADREKLIGELKRVNGFKTMLISKEVTMKTGALFNQTIYPVGGKKKLIPVKKNRPTAIYGGYSGNSDAYLAIIRLVKKGSTEYKVVGIPVRERQRLLALEKTDHAAFLAQTKEVIANRLAKEKKNRKTGEVTRVTPSFDLVLPKVFLNQLVIDRGAKFTLGSAAYQYNAQQLILSSGSLATLQRDFRKNPSDTVDEQLLAVYDEIVAAVNQYFPLYDKNKFREKLTAGRELFATLPIYDEYKNGRKARDGKVNTLSKILQGLHANSRILKIEGLKIKTPLGMFQTKSGISLSEEAILVYQSPTGLFERRVQLKQQ